MTQTLPVQVVFFDLRDTLGEVDRPGHLAPYRPSTEKLLTALRQVVGAQIGIITNLPAEVTADEGRRMVAEAVLSESNGQRLTIGDFVHPKGIVINHEVGASKPDPRIYQHAAAQFGVPAESCLFVGENLIEVLAAQAAGMRAQLKPCPPGREFLPSVVTRLGATEKDSGRAFEAFLEHEHLLGDRFFNCGFAIAAGLRPLAPGEPIPRNLRTAIGLFMYIVDNFADQVHFSAEEAIIPLAVARGMDPAKAQWVLNQHEQARAYWQAMGVAWRRIQSGDPLDAQYAVGDFWRLADAFVILFRHHAIRENDEMYPEIGRHLTDADDTLVMNLIRQIGPPDVTPYVAIVAATEEALEI